MKKVLLIGNGAREHVIAETLRRSSKYEVQLYVVGKAVNPGIAELAEDYLVGDICDLDLISDYAQKHKPDFAFLGPEAPIAAGVADRLLQLEIHSVAPLQTVGRLETSKSFTRDLLEKYDIPGNPKFRVFNDDQWLEEFFEELGDDYVVKADGLKGGKGVKVSGDHLHGQEEGLEYAKECLESDGRVVVEEKLVGQEFSLMCFCDGETVVPMPAAQDHKRAYENDEGPNTGGMGSYADSDHSLPFLEADDLHQALGITRAVAKALFEEVGCYFKGIMYGGFIATKEGVRLIEFNARFGDPEVMNVLPLLETDFVDVCEAIIDKRLDQIDVSFAEQASVCKYVVPDGYPTDPAKDKKIEVGEMPEGVRVYYAAVDQRADGLYLSGSRAVACVGVGRSLVDAEQLAQAGVERVEGPVFYRKDIATKDSLRKKAEMMAELRKEV